MAKTFLMRWATLGLLAMAALNLPDTAATAAALARDCGVCWTECEGFDQACRDIGGEPNLCSCSLDGVHCYVGDCYRR